MAATDQTPAEVILKLFIEKLRRYQAGGWPAFGELEFSVRFHQGRVVSPRMTVADTEDPGRQHNKDFHHR